MNDFEGGSCLASHNLLQQSVLVGVPVSVLVAVSRGLHDFLGFVYTACAEQGREGGTLQCRGLSRFVLSLLESWRGEFG